MKLRGGANSIRRHLELMEDPIQDGGINLPPSRRHLEFDPLAHRKMAENRVIPTSQLQTSIIITIIVGMSWIFVIRLVSSEPLYSIFFRFLYQLFRGFYHYSNIHEWTNKKKHPVHISQCVCACLSFNVQRCEFPSYLDLKK